MAGLEGLKIRGARRSQGNPGRAWSSQGVPGRARRSDEPGGARRSQGNQGRARKSQEGPEGARTVPQDHALMPLPVEPTSRRNSREPR